MCPCVSDVSWEAGVGHLMVSDISCKVFGNHIIERTDSEVKNRDVCYFSHPLTRQPLWRSLPTGTVLQWVTAQQAASIGPSHGEWLNGNAKRQCFGKNSLPKLFMLQEAFTCSSLNVLVITWPVSTAGKSQWCCFIEAFRLSQTSLILCTLIFKLNVSFYVVIFITVLCQ